MPTEEQLVEAINALVAAVNKMQERLDAIETRFNQALEPNALGNAICNATLPDSVLCSSVADLTKGFVHAD